MKNNQNNCITNIIRTYIVKPMKKVLFGNSEYWNGSHTCM